MDMDKKMYKKVENLDTATISKLLTKCDMEEFVEFAKEKELDGRKLMSVTEGIVKLWRPKINANKLILFIQHLKSNPEIYLGILEKNNQELTKNSIDKNIEVKFLKTLDTVTEDNTILSIESQYQTVKKSKVAVLSNITEEYYKTVTKPKEVAPINLVSEKHLDFKKIKENNQAFISDVNKSVQKSDDDSIVSSATEECQTAKNKTKEDNVTFNNIEEIIKKMVPAKSFLYRNKGNKNDVTSYLPMDAGTPKKRKLFRLSSYDYPIFDLKRFSKPEGDRGYYPMKRNSRFFIHKTKSPKSRPKYKSISSTEELKYPEDHFYEDLCYNDIENERSSMSSGQKPYKVKIQELFQSFKMPFFKKSDEVEEKKEDIKDERVVVEEREPVYENSDSLANMYDSVHVKSQEEQSEEVKKPKLQVEDYLEPVQLNKDYCDVSYKQKEDSLLGYIMSIFESRFGRRETNDAQTEDSDADSPELKWTEAPHHMADRPLPVPVENEPYYMDIDRHEAENLLKGQPDGMFVLRPSSQANHAYTLSVSCTSSVHNVGVRRRQDGRLALGFARKGERSFADITALLRHHRKRRLLLMVHGGVIGATTLNDTPQYYQTPCNVPVRVI